MPASDAFPVPRKNTAWRVYFAIRKSDGTLITSWTGADSEESLDGGAFSDCTNEATEIGTSGCGYLDLTAAEMNADAVLVKITVTNTGALPLVLTLFPEEAGDYRVSDSQKVDLNTIKTQAVTAASGVTIPSNIASSAEIADVPTVAEFEARTLVASNYATASQINSLQVNTRASVQVPVEIETPDSGTQIWKIRLFLFDEEGNMEAPDSTPTITLVNAAGTNRASRLSVATVLSTGAYSWDYTATDDDAEEQLNWTFTVVEGGLTRIYPATSYVVEETAYRFSSTDRATLNSRASQTSVDTIPASVSIQIGNDIVDGNDVWSVDAPSSLLTRGGFASSTGMSTLFTTLTTKIRKFFQLSMRKDAAIATDNATELTEINATGGSGAGSYANTTDALEAVRDRGDSAWTTGGGGGTESSLMISTTIATLASQTSFTLTAGSADNDAYNNQLVVITDASTSTQKARGIVSDYVGSTKTVTIQAAPVFTIAAGDSISIIAVGSAGGSQSVTLQLGATIPLTLGQVTGLTQDLVVGNSYTEELGTRIPVTLTDANGDAIAVTFGDRELSDADCTIKCVLHPVNARNTDNVTAAAQGICEFVPASGATPASLWIELPGTETTRLTPGVYSVQFHAVWNDGELVSLAWKGTCKFVRIIRPKS